VHPPPRAGAQEEGAQPLGPVHRGWNPMFLFYPYTLMGWQHTFIHGVAHRPDRPNERSYYNILTNTGTIKNFNLICHYMTLYINRLIVLFWIFLLMGSSFVYWSLNRSFLVTTFENLSPN
jgi:hypothetical protein